MRDRQIIKIGCKLSRILKIIAFDKNPEKLIFILSPRDLIVKKNRDSKWYRYHIEITKEEIPETEAMELPPSIPVYSDEVKE